MSCSSKLRGSAPEIYVSPSDRQFRCRSTGLPRLACDGVDLNFDSVSQPRLHRGARRTDPGKKLRVRSVESAKSLNVSEVASALHHVSKAVASALQDLSDVVERQSGLFFNRS